MNRISDKICVVLGGMMIGFIFVPFIGYIWIWTQPSTDLMAAVIGVFVGIISISVPVIIGNLAKSLAIYNNRHISSILSKEKSYIRIRQLIPILCTILILFLFFSFEDTKNDMDWISRIIATIGVLLCIYALFVFKRFWDVSFKFAVNTDQAIMERAKAEVEEGLSSGIVTKEHLEYMDIYHQILTVKLKNKSYADLKDVFKQLTELTVKLIQSALSSAKTEPQTIRTILYKYYLSAYGCWRRSYKEASDEASGIYSLYNQTLADVLASEREYDTVHVSGFETSVVPMFYLYQRMANDLTSKDTEGIPHCRRYPWVWYIDILSGREVHPDQLDLLDSRLLAAMKTAVHNENKVVFEAYVAASIEGVWMLYTWERPMTSDAASSKILDTIENTIFQTFLPSDYNALKRMIDNEVHAPNIDKAGLRTYLTDTFKYNRLRLTVLILGAYCLFKRRYDYIRLLLDYNQPKQSETTFLNRDIVPSDINILMKLYQNSVFFEPLYHHVWEGHNDGQYWFKRFIALLVYRVSLRPDAPALDLIEEHTKQDLEYTMYCLEKIGSYFESFFTPRTIRSCGVPVDNGCRSMEYLQGLKGDIRKKISSIVRTNELDPEKVAAFKETVKRNIDEGSLWLTLSQNEYPPEECSEIGDSFKVGYNRIMEKSFLAKNDRGIYVGFEIGLASVIVNHIDYQIESRIRNRLRNEKKSQDAITKENYRTKLFDLDDSWMVIFLNYRKFIEWLPNNTSFKWEKRHVHMMGTTDKGVEFYSWNDPADRTSRAIVIQKTAIPHITWGSAQDPTIDVKDLHIEKESKDKILEAGLQVLNRYESQQEKEAFLDKHVQILISGTIQCQIVSDAEVYILDNI